MCNNERAERDSRAYRQQEDEVRALRDAHYLAFNIDREIDTIAFKQGRIWLCDNKYSDNDIFYIDSKDIAKGLDQAQKLAEKLDFKIEVYFRIDMFFPRHKSKNRRYIICTESDRGWSIRVTRCESGKFALAKVKKGEANDRVN